MRNAGLVIVALERGVIKARAVPIPPQPAPAEEARASRYYIPELDVLRLFAFLSVFFFHVPPGSVMEWHPGVARTAVSAGSLGVDLFFTLSAYLITKLLLQEREREGRVDVKSFYIRRVLRIWPLYYFFLAIAAGLATFGGRFSVTPSYMMSLAVFSGNYGIIKAFGNPTRWHANLLVGPLWSVSVEEQFYLLWPLALRRLSRRGVAIAALAMLVLTSLDRFRAIELGYLGIPFPIVTKLFYLDSFAVGILIAVIPIPDWITNLSIFQRLGLAIAGILAWFLAVHFGDYLTTAPTLVQTMLSYPAVAIGSGAMLLAALGAGRAGAAFMLNERLRYLGKISYGLYVYHGLAIALAQVLVLGGAYQAQSPFQGAVYVAAALAITVLIAAASYRWLESPFLRMKDRFTHVPSRPV
ncbi:MAG TPA: acyltransferase [Candidatus Binataceae bacterium]|nr:acyltransferase [Candidatus Binataceae bacterium]